jgi:hypothetical protein
MEIATIFPSTLIFHVNVKKKLIIFVRKFNFFLEILKLNQFKGKEKCKLPTIVEHFHFRLCSQGKLSMILFGTVRHVS